MTPDEKMMLMEVYEYMQSRKVQQLTYPLDDQSKASMEVPTGEGLGNTTPLFDTVNIASTPTSIPVPLQYAGTILLKIEDVTYEIPFIS